MFITTVRALRLITCLHTEHQLNSYTGGFILRGVHMSSKCIRCYFACCYCVGDIFSWTLS